MRVISWNEVNEEKLNENITRKMIWGNNVMVTRWEVAPNTSLPLHDHVSEQVTMVISGSVTLLFPGEEDRTLRAGDMLIIPSSKPHGVKVGPEGCVVLDIFSPIREDFIQGTASYIKSGPDQDSSGSGIDEAEAYHELHGLLLTAGVKIGQEDLREIPLELVARYAYERECVSLGQLRTILGLNKGQAKELLRQWKHGDDHSEASYRRKLERMIVLPAVPKNS